MLTDIPLLVINNGSEIRIHLTFLIKLKQNCKQSMSVLIKFIIEINIPTEKNHRLLALPKYKLLIGTSKTFDNCIPLKDFK